MEQLVSSWGRQLIFLILLATVLEMLLPAGELRRYVRMLMGLVVVVAVAEPLVNLARGPVWLEEFVVSESVSAAHSYVEAGREISKLTAEDAATVVLREAEATLASLVREVAGVIDVALDLSQYEPLMHIRIDPGRDRGEVVTRVRTLASTHLALDPTQVRLYVVEVEGGGS